jgi:phosphonate transport system ATP-binding protein
VLTLNGLTKDFGSVRAVNSVYLKLDKGQMIGVIGRSGAGKSTLLRLINRLIDPTAGQITYEGKAISELKGRQLLKWRARCGMIFQQFNLVGRLDVLTNVLMGRIAYRATLPSLLKIFSPSERARAILALERLDMADLAFQRADTLSGGQQQRVAIAKAIVQEPRIVLADEPIASLDPHNATRVMDALQDINRQEGITIICNLHHLQTAKRYCGRIIGMSQGRVVFDGPPQDLTLERAREVYSADVDDEELEEALSGNLETEPEITEPQSATA